MNKSIVMDGDEVKKHLVNVSVMHVKNGNTHEYIDINGNDNNDTNNGNHDINGHTTNTNNTNNNDNNYNNNNNGNIIRNGNHLTQDTQKKINIVITTPKSNDKITTPPSNDNEDSFGDDFDINNNDDDDDDDNNGYSSNNSPYTNDENNSTPLSLHKKQQNTMQLNNNYTTSGNNHEPTGTTVINRLSAVFANSPKNNNEPRSTLVVHDPGNSIIFDEKSDNEDETYNESPFLPTERLPKHLISDSVESLDPDFVLEPAYFEDEMDIYPNDKIPALNTNAISNDKTNDNNETKQHYILKSVDITQSIKWDKPGVSIDHTQMTSMEINTKSVEIKFANINSESKMSDDDDDSDTDK
eukprot:CAMPEP_0114655824 /NCGR_PEP_ID=MMETSP0191-20121206/11467_1 /TAXON_ID=126664 /ORGANISM="Sorites sp." /LENGTH=354 /DNA_ID=CAMNT_0001871899 /DNA_START=268 /DNA_END=1332 /DNA_ORIENTATION=-